MTFEIEYLNNMSIFYYFWGQLLMGTDLTTYLI